MARIDADVIAAENAGPRGGRCGATMPRSASSSTGAGSTSSG